MKISQIWIGFIILSLGASMTSAMTASEIMEKVDARDTGRTQISTATPF